MYKTFVRSRLEYGAGICYQWMVQGLVNITFPSVNIKQITQSRNSNSKHQRLLCIGDTQALHLEALQWITGYKANLSPICSILAIPLSLQWFSDLACMFTQHMDKLHEDHPIHGFMDYLNTNTSHINKKQYIIPLCFNHPDERKWKNSTSSTSSINVNRNLSLKDYLKLNLLSKLEAHSLLPKYHGRQARVKGTSMSSILKLRSKYLQKRCLSWSLNTFQSRS
jgi:hypothetical protein